MDVEVSFVSSDESFTAATGEAKACAFLPDASFFLSLKHSVLI